MTARIRDEDFTIDRPPPPAPMRKGSDVRANKHKGEAMHYRNGREAKNGDKVIQIGFDGKINALGVLYDAVAGNDYCNGKIAPVGETNACLVDCLHVDDVLALLAEKGLDKRPAGK